MSDDNDGHGGALHALRRASEAYAAAHPREPHTLMTITREELEWLEANPDQGEALWRVKLARAKAILAGRKDGGAS